MKISLLIHTASFDDFLIDQGIKSYFSSLVNCLNHQTFRNFELIYIDTFYDHNKNYFNEIINKSPFQIKHVPIHHNHRYWFDKGYCYISAAKNTGILYADGELLVTCDDAEFFPENFLDKYWRHYKNSGGYMLATHKRLKNIILNGDHPKIPISGDEYINDHRLLNPKEETKEHKHGNWAYAGTSFSLEDGLLLNGFNERMDGCKSLEDCDFGTRLILLGRKFITDKNGFLYILNHPSYGDMSSTNWDGIINDGNDKEIRVIKKIENLIAIENYGVLKCAEELLDIKANSGKITQEHLKIIQRETIKYRHFDPLSPENKEKLDIWLGTPTFNLRSEREQLRKSGEWKWKI